jgi:hypothetical protein
MVALGVRASGLVAEALDVARCGGTGRAARRALLSVQTPGSESW